MESDCYSGRCQAPFSLRIRVFNQFLRSKTRIREHTVTCCPTLTKQTPSITCRAISYDKYTANEYSAIRGFLEGLCDDIKTSPNHQPPPSTSKTVLTTLLRKADPGITIIMIIIIIIIQSSKIMFLIFLRWHKGKVIEESKAKPKQQKRKIK